MHARNRRTRAAITGTLETIHGRCGLVPAGFGRNDDGRITYEYEGGTTMYWDSSAQVRTDDGERIYVDENEEHVPESQIQLHREDGTPEKWRRPRRPPGANGVNDPEAAARHVAQRVIATIVNEVEEYDEALEAAREIGRQHGEEDAEKAIDEAHEAFVRTASNGITKIEVASGLILMSTARDGRTPIIDHVGTAVIHLDGNGIELRCTREDGRFSLDEVSAREYGHICRVRPDPKDATRLDVYVDTLLHAGAPGNDRTPMTEQTFHIMDLDPHRTLCRSKQQKVWSAQEWLSDEDLRRGRFVRCKKCDKLLTPALRTALAEARELEAAVRDAWRSGWIDGRKRPAAGVRRTHTTNEELVNECRELGRRIGARSAAANQGQTAAGTGPRSAKLEQRPATT